MTLAVLRYLLLLPLNIVMLVVAFVLAPILPLFASEDGWLPRWLWWFQTPDNPLDGDEGFLTIHAPYKGLGLSYGQKYVNRMFWMWRNPKMGFGMTVMAFTPQEPYIVKRIGGEKTLDGGMTEGWYCVAIRNPGGKIAWQIFIVHFWSERAFLKINLGWKLWSAPAVCAYVFSPTKLYSRIGG